MKILISLSTLILVCYLNAFSQNELKTVNVTDNQKVSGDLIVKLHADSLQNYKKVSYCIDGELLQNIYDQPFTMEFDTRDFDNGKHELSVRGTLFCRFFLPRLS